MELEFIRHIRELTGGIQAGSRPGHLKKSIGDDCAEVIPAPGRNLLITTDTICEDIHFKLSYFSPFQLGRKLASVNLSDIAAMGGDPKWAVLSAEVPEKLADASSPFWNAFFQGLTGRLSRFGAVLAGGDTVSASSRYLSLTLTLVGEVERGRAVYRSGARQGDLIYCSGYTGEAACGLEILKNPFLSRLVPGPVRKRLTRRHLDPRPRVALGSALSGAGVNSLIDISDGIASDLAHIGEESNLKGVVFQKFLPVSRAVSIFCRAAGKKTGKALPRASFEYVLSGGEDFELLWTVSPDKRRAAEKAALEATGVRPFLLGRMEKGRGCFLDTGKKRFDISFKGYEH